jgi:ATP-dependent HslUV protease ATP-binding subunit HslU
MDYENEDRNGNEREPNETGQGGYWTSAVSMRYSHYGMFSERSTFTQTRQHQTLRCEHVKLKQTEVARRMAMMNDAPFLKVEATKFTEVGYHGRDVDQIVRDLLDVSMQLTKKKHTEQYREQAKSLVEERILDILAGPSSDSAARGRASFQDMLRQGLLDDQEIEIDVPVQRPGAGGGGGTGGGGDIDSNNPQIVAMSDLMQRLASGGGKRQSTERKKLPISEAREIILEVELERLLENVDLRKAAVNAVEESGIVFIDEIDKICSSREGFSSRSADASAEGVQRDLLPLIEGTTISTKHGNVNTDYILFIASGAFHAVKVSDMLPELQGRLPIRVELMGLTEDDLYKILTQPVANVRLIIGLWFYPVTSFSSHVLFSLCYFLNTPP